MEKFSYNGGKLIVEHLNVGMVSDTFKILRNEDNKLDFSVSDIIIRIVEHL